MKYMSTLIFILSLLLAVGCANKSVSKDIPTQEITQQPTKQAVPLNNQSTALTAASDPQQHINHSVINHGSTSSKKVALTFDDGPDNTYTPKILDILKNNHIHATFFVIGEHAEKYPQILKRIEQEGHIIGNHTWDHADLPKLTKDQIQGEIDHADKVIQSIVGHAPLLFRAPYGAISQDVVADASATGHQTIGWSVDTLDWDGKSVQQILSAVKKEVKPGAIILQHCAGGKGGKLSNTVEALPQIITYLKSKGYSFVSIPELLSS
jgi:polysaccharide deacetylase family sporulation protein PdaB